jgi:hypothetical protein
MFYVIKGYLIVRCSFRLMLGNERVAEFAFLLWTLQNSLMSVKMGEKDFILIKQVLQNDNICWKFN